ncbi:MAG: sigma-70 family RNA polymerase sigma factor [Deltaproteobacteria bacterium]|nr:sigma-70 family RNA polymerase sigma factor [Deltaproteobacteria bacterium]
MASAPPLPERPAAAAPVPAPAARLDAETLERLYLRLERPMFNVVYRWLWDAHDAQETVQDAFLRIWRRRDDVRVETLEPLLYRTALNLAANRLRARRLRRWFLGPSVEEVDAASSGPDVETQAADRERLAAVRRAVEALPVRLRRVFVLCELAELPYEQVAATLEIPAGTVASRRHEALGRLRHELGEER